MLLFIKAKNGESQLHLQAVLLIPPGWGGVDEVLIILIKLPSQPKLYKSFHLSNRKKIRFIMHSLLNSGMRSMFY